MWLLGEPSGRRTWVATLAAFAGAGLVIGPRFHIAGHVAAIATAGALCSALAMIWLRKLSSTSGAPESPEAIVLHFSVVATVVMTLLAIPTWRGTDMMGGALLVVTGVLGGVAQLAMTRAYALDRAARVGMVSYFGIALTHVLDRTP